MPANIFALVPGIWIGASHVTGKLCLHRGLFAVRTSSFLETAHLELADRPPFNAHSMLWTPPPLDCSGSPPRVCLKAQAQCCSITAILKQGWKGGGGVGDYPGEGGGETLGYWYARLLHWALRASWCAACFLQGPKLHTASTGYIRHLPTCTCAKS